MKLYLAAILAVGVILSLSDARPQITPKPRKNFGPQLRNNFEIKPASLFESSLFANDPVEIAKQYIALKANVAINGLRVASSSTNKRNGVTQVYLQQVVNGIDVSNGVANVNVDKSGNVISAGNSFYNGPAPAQKLAAQLSASEAVLAFASFLNIEVPSSVSLVATQGVDAEHVTISGATFAVADIPAEQNYIQTESGELVLVWALRVDMNENWYNAFVDARTGQVVSLVDWVSDAAYQVYQFGINDPSVGERSVLRNPARPEASPAGWHSQPGNRDYTDTQGNNVHAQNNPTGGTGYQNNYRPDGGLSLTFAHPIDFSQAPKQYEDAAITNLFYWNNIIHDFYYIHGFDEESGNFQYDNFGKGGAGNDAVIAFAQDGSGVNNANFATPPDGSQGRMRMYIWTRSQPSRDGDLDGGIVIHEYSHGLSNRLTGGRTNVNCLGFGQPGGMGEGWGDIIATVTRVTATTTRNQDYAMGDYSANDAGGIRNYVYSTNMTTNPSTFGFLSRPGYSGVHAIGEVWAVILYEVFWNLVGKNGFDPNWMNPQSTGGNIIFIQLLLDGMKLQPCLPNFLDARNAIIQADEINNGGANRCAIWAGFAKRGLGINAVAGNGSGENFELPTGC